MGVTDYFKGSDSIILQPNDVEVPYNFIFTVCSASTKNDGALPFGETISSVAVTAHTEAGVSATTDIIAFSTWASFTENLRLSYPTTAGAGRYHLTFVVALSNTSETIEFDFNRVVARNI